jgi:serine/threonine protein kinase
LTPARLKGWTLLAKEGEGSSGIVFRASRGDGTLAALKVARTADAWVGREIGILARLGRRWGPELVEAGRVDERVVGPDGAVLARGAAWMATTWIDGEALAERVRNAPLEERRALAAIVAHGAARGLDELHKGGVRHGDVKPANILLARGWRGTSVDRAASRGASLVDLDLASDVADGSLIGGTPRYLAPELRAGEAATPAADLYALGLVLAEVLLPELASAPDLDGARVVVALEASA